MKARHRISSVIALVIVSMLCIGISKAYAHGIDVEVFIHEPQELLQPLEEHCRIYKNSSIYVCRESMAFPVIVDWIRTIPPWFRKLYWIYTELYDEVYRLLKRYGNRSLDLYVGYKGRDLRSSYERCLL